MSRVYFSKVISAVALVLLLVQFELRCAKISTHTKLSLGAIKMESDGTKAL